MPAPAYVANGDSILADIARAVREHLPDRAEQILHAAERWKAGYELVEDVRDIVFPPHEMDESRQGDALDDFQDISLLLEGRRECFDCNGSGFAGGLHPGEKPEGHRDQCPACLGRKIELGCVICHSTSSHKRITGPDEPDGEGTILCVDEAACAERMAPEIEEETPVCEECGGEAMEAAGSELRVCDRCLRRRNGIQCLDCDSLGPFHHWIIAEGGNRERRALCSDCYERRQETEGGPRRRGA